MMDLAARDSYMQKFAKKVFFQHEQEPKKTPFAPSKGKSETGPPKKKKSFKDVKKSFKEVKKPHPKSPKKPSPSAAAQNGPPAAKQPKTQINGSTKPAPKGGKVPSDFSTVDVLRKRLHDKIEESRGQGTAENPLSEAVLAKRAKRKIERERKKRKRKEFILKKKLAEENSQEAPVEIKKEPEQKKQKKQGVISTPIMGTAENPLSEATLAKRAKRKIEKQRKKTKRKELILKEKLAEEKSQEAPVEIKKEPEPAPAANKTDVTALVKIQKKKKQKKKQSV